MTFISKFVKWLVIILCVCLILWLITYLTTNVLLNKIDDFLNQNRNLSNFSLLYSKPLNNYISLLSFYQWFRPNNPKLLVAQSYLLTLRNYPNHSKMWDKDIETIKSNLRKIIFIDKNQLSSQNYMELAFAAAISGDNAQSDIFSDLSLKQAPTSQIRETAFFNYWYLKDYWKAKEYYEKYFELINGYDKDPAAFVEYLDCLLSSYIVATDKLKQTLQYVYLIDGADEPMLPFLRQRVSLKLYELCYLNPSNIQDILGSDCNIYYEKAKNDFSVSLKYTPENPVSPDLITSQIKIRLFQLGIPQSFLYFNVNQGNLETYKIVFKESYQQLRDTEILYAKENIFNNYFYLFLLGYISEFNNNLAEAKEFYEQYLSILQNQSILDDQEQQMMNTVFYRLARVNIIIDEDLYLRQISDNLEHPDLFKSFETVRTQFSNIISQENIFLNQNIANQLLKYQYE